jgi:serine/threonine protein kinase
MAFPPLAMHGKYTILRSLGKGGMGALHLAGETIANRQRQVVIKEMLEYYDPKDVKAGARARKRFETEAETLASLNIPGVPQIFDYFSEGGRNYIVMQFIEGQNLETGLTHLDDNGNQVQGRPYPVERVRQWGVRLCKILEGLAAQNVIHMDIKPANLIVDRSGDVWLVDFGTARSRHIGQSGSQVGLQKSSVYGTIGYAPPEQVAGKAETRSDVYALAATLYHLMTDDDPREPPHKFVQIDRLPKDISQALKLALVKDVKRRVAAAEFGHSLEARPGSGPAFRWRDGTVVYEPKDLPVTANRQWEEATNYYQGDDWAKWFKDLHRHDLVAQLDAIKSAQQNTDLGLDAFLRILDPAFPPPQLHSTLPLLNAGVIPWQTQRELDLRLANQGSGCLQGRFVNIPAGLQVAPAEFVAHDWRAVKVKVDARVLSPSATPQTLQLNIDAGNAGQIQLPVTVTVPEPDLKVSSSMLDLGPVYRGGERVCSFSVGNPGGSAFLGKVKCNQAWVKATPAHFRCVPGGSKDINVVVDTHRMPVGEQAAQLQVQARAGQWERAEPVQIRFKVSVLKTFMKYWAPPLAWVSGWSVYGVFLGAILGTLMAMLIDHIAALSTGMLAGALFGALICAFAGIMIGGLGGLGYKRGLEGAKRGGLYGTITGALIGSIAGGFWYNFLVWLGLGLSEGIGFEALGMLVGWLTGGILGTVLWFMPRQ